MPYLLDRHRAIWTDGLVALVRGAARRVRTQMIFRDNSIYNTLTRPTTILRLVRRMTSPGAAAPTTQEQLGRVTALICRATQP